MSFIFSLSSSLLFSRVGVELFRPVCQMSLIVFTCDMLSTQSFRPSSVLVFFSAGFYCAVLIKRQMALAEAERGANADMRVLFHG